MFLESAVAQRIGYGHSNTTARVTKQFLANFMNTFPRRFMSPYMKPSQHTWEELDYRVRRRPVVFWTLKELARPLQEQWRAISALSIRHLISSMPRRRESVIDARGRTLR